MNVWLAIKRFGLAVMRWFHLDVTNAQLAEQRGRLVRARALEDEAQSKVTAAFERLAMALRREAPDGRR